MTASSTTMTAHGSLVCCQVHTRYTVPELPSDCCYKWLIASGRLRTGYIRRTVIGFASACLPYLQEWFVLGVQV